MNKLVEEWKKFNKEWIDKHWIILDDESKNAVLNLDVLNKHWYLKQITSEYVSIFKKILSLTKVKTYLQDYKLKNDEIMQDFKVFWHKNITFWDLFLLNNKLHTLNSEIIYIELNIKNFIDWENKREEENESN